MPWSKLDDQFPFNRKVIMVGKDGRALYVTGLCWSSGQLTDGIIDDAAIPMLAAVSEVTDAQAAVTRLVETGLWERVSGGYEIHDYHDYNPSSGEVRAMREARAEAGRRGGLASVASKSQANAQANAEQNLTPSPSPSPSPVPAPDPIPFPVAAAAAREVRPPDNGYGRALDRHGIIVNSRAHAEMWGEIWDDAGSDMFEALLVEAAKTRNGIPTVGYVSAIWKRCRDEGVAPGQWKGGNGHNGRASPMAAVDAAIEEYGRQERERQRGNI